MLNFKEKKDKKISVRLDESQDYQLMQYAKEFKCKRSELIRIALEDLYTKLRVIRGQEDEL